MIQIYQAIPGSIHPVFDDIYITECGFSHINDRDYHFVRQHGRDDYHLIYMIKNHGKFVTSNSFVTLHAGELILFPPHQKHGYKIDACDEAIYYWLHFSGNRTEEILEAYKLCCETVYNIGLSTRIPRLFDFIIEELQAQLPQCSEICAGLLRQLLAVFSQKKALPSQGRTIQTVIRALSRDFRENIPLEDYAKKCGYSKYHFIRLFKEATGHSPIDYRNILRIQNACTLLEQTPYSIHEISEELGFSDPSYFSKLFKQHINKSPLAYRKEMNLEKTTSP